MQVDSQFKFLQNHWPYLSELLKILFYDFLYADHNQILIFQRLWQYFYLPIPLFFHNVRDRLLRLGCVDLVNVQLQFPAISFIG